MGVATSCFLWDPWGVVGQGPCRGCYARGAVLAYTMPAVLGMDLGALGYVVGCRLFVLRVLGVLVRSRGRSSALALQKVAEFLKGLEWTELLKEILGVCWACLCTTRQLASWIPGAILGTGGGTPT